jgi:hypothetical protein
MRKVLVGVCPSDRHTPQGVSHGAKPGRRPPDRTAGLHSPRTGFARFPLWRPPSRPLGGRRGGGRGAVVEAAGQE